MTSLALPSLEIQGFRGFQNLHIEKFGRVNLIVGKNNIGKSCLLEAIQVYATRGYPGFLWQILAAHDEDKGRQHIDEALSSVKSLFFGRKEITGPTDPLKIGPVGNLGEQLQVSVDFYAEEVVGEFGRSTFYILQPEEYSLVENPVPRFSIRFGVFSTSNSLINGNMRLKSFTFPAGLLVLILRQMGWISRKPHNCGMMSHLPIKSKQS